MRGSSINFEKANRGALNHNDRTETQEVNYLLPEEYRLENEYDLSAIKASEKIKKLFTASSDNFKKLYGQRLQAKSYLWEAVVNLDSHHTLKEVKKLVQELEKITGFTAVQSAIHRDEGVVGKDKNGQSVALYNYHAHVVFFTLNIKNGIQLYRKDISKPLRKRYEAQVVQYQDKNQRLQPAFHSNEVLKIKKKQKWSIQNRSSINEAVRKQFKRDGHIVYDREHLSYLQTIVAQELGMPRGSVSVEAEAKRLGVILEPNPAVRKGHKQFKASKRAEEEITNRHINGLAVVENSNKQALLEYTEKNKELETLIQQMRQDILNKDERIKELIDENKEPEIIVKEVIKEVPAKITIDDVKNYPITYDSKSVTIDILLQKHTNRIEIMEKEVEFLQKLAYIGQEYPKDFDENDNPICFEKETWKEVAEYEKDRVLNLTYETEYLIKRVEELENLAYYYVPYFNTELGDADYNVISYKDENKRLKEELQKVKQEIEQLKNLQPKAMEIKSVLEESSNASMPKPGW